VRVSGIRARMVCRLVETPSKKADGEI
jgi:hypothetical protein